MMSNMPVKVHTGVGERGGGHPWLKSGHAVVDESRVENASPVCRPREWCRIMQLDLRTLYTTTCTDEA